MSREQVDHVADLRGATRLAIDAVAGITGLVEGIHGNIARQPTKLGGPLIGGAVNGVTGLVYSSIRGVTRALGGSLDLALRAFALSQSRLHPRTIRYRRPSDLIEAWDFVLFIPGGS